MPLCEKGTSHGKESKPERPREPCDRHLRSLCLTEKTGEDTEAVRVWEDPDVGNPASQSKNLRSLPFFWFCGFVFLWFCVFVVLLFCVV